MRSAWTEIAKAWRVAALRLEVAGAALGAVRSRPSAVPGPGALR